MSATTHDTPTPGQDPAQDPAPDPAHDPAQGPVPAAADYVARVREALADLPPDVVDDLVDGLAADLAELAAESSTPLADRLGPAEAYAGELRSSAGVAPRGPYVGLPPGAAVRGPSPREVLRAQRARLRSRSWWPAASDFATTVRPAWWVARAIIALSLVLYWAFGVRWGSANFGVLAELVVLAVLVGAVAASVELGRGRWAGVRWLPPVVLVGNVVAVLAIPAALSWATTSATGSYGQVGVSYVTEEVAPSEGLYLDGQPVSNLYPYDAQGRPLTGVQLLDDYGRVVQVGQDQRVQWAGGAPESYQPAVGVDGTTRWNAYPLRTATGSEVAPEVSLSPLLLSSGGMPVEAAAPGTASDPAASSGPAASSDPAGAAAAGDADPDIAPGDVVVPDAAAQP